ncbi:11-beta-hydroxysteroid dehydrogenase-like 3 [Rutidosis leptorrhynchoides]|uniref:11-beta-hydroxysteroid dehydrogenase-like 3 n=1 Tax=Rutidosis leptorrhynchoides TaxID=125765 RepID=UPI003A9A03BB
MDIIYNVLNVIYLVNSIFMFLIWVPTFWLYNLLRVSYKSSYPESLAGKVMLITGASAGIGEHMAMEFAKAGACLALVARREEQLRSVAECAKAMGSPDVIVIPADVSKLEDCSMFIDQTINHFGKLDYLVNNAAIASFGLFENEARVSDNVPVMDINFWGSVYTTHFALPHLKKNKGKIIVICSCGSWFASPRVSIYNASKAALLSFFETLKIEVDSAINITIVTPGIVETRLSNEKWLREGCAWWIPRLTPEMCAKEIMSCIKRGDKTCTVPSWMKTIFLWKMLCPEIFNRIMTFLFISWPKISSKKNRIPNLNLAQVF